MHISKMDGVTKGHIVGEFIKQKIANVRPVREGSIYLRVNGAFMYKCHRINCMVCICLLVILLFVDDFCAKRWAGAAIRKSMFTLTI